jgi:hypothetical protein
VSTIDRAACSGGELEFCPLCKTTDLYVQKDFSAGLGLFIVLVGIAISTVFWYYEMPLFTYLVLIISIAFDFLMYYRVPDVTICYRCLAQVRGQGSNALKRYKPFDLGIGERYRQERMRAQQIRESQS